MIRYYIAKYAYINSVDWTKVIPYLQGYLNNSASQSTGLAPNEINYGFKVHNTLAILSGTPNVPDVTAKEFSRRRQLYRDHAEESITFTNVFAKHHYNKRHKAVNLAVGSKAYIKLGEGYTIPGVNPKLHQQRVGPFAITRKEGARAYHLELPLAMSRLHPVFSIAQLEPYPLDKDPYNRPQNADLPDIMEKDRVGLDADEYRVEAIVGKRLSGHNVQYLVKWKDCGVQENVWYNIRKLQDCLDLVEQYEERNHDKLTSKRRKNNSASTAPGMSPSVVLSPTPQLAPVRTDGTDPQPIKTKQRRGRPRKTLPWTDLPGTSPMTPNVSSPSPAPPTPSSPVNTPVRPNDTPPVRPNDRSNDTSLVKTSPVNPNDAPPVRSNDTSLVKTSSSVAKPLPRPMVVIPRRIGPP